MNQLFTNKCLLITESDMKLIEQGKQALAYYFEALARAEPDKQIIFVLNLQGSGLAQRKYDEISVQAVLMPKFAVMKNYI